MEASDASVPAFSGALGRFFHEEGCLREHVFWNGRYLDLHILAVYRETWVQHAPSFLQRLGARDEPGGPAVEAAVDQPLD